MWINKSIPLVTGMDANYGEGHRPPPVLHRCINAYSKKKGEIEKRPGWGNESVIIYDGLTLARDLFDVNGLGDGLYPRALITNKTLALGATSEDKIILAEGQLLKYTTNGWLPANITGSTATEGIYTPTAVGCGMEYKQVQRSITDHKNSTAAASNTYAVTVWYEEDSTSLYYSVYEIATGSVIVDGVLSATTTYAQAVADSTNVGFVYAAGGNLYLVNLNSPFAPATYTLKTDVHANNTYYVAPAATGLVLAYRTTVALRTTAFFSTFAGVVSGSTNYATTREITAVAIEYNSVQSKYVIALAMTAGADPDVTTKVLSTTLVDQALDVSFSYNSTLVGVTGALRITLGFSNIVHGQTAAAGAYDCYVLWEVNVIDPSQPEEFRVVEMGRRFTASAGGAKILGNAGMRATLLTTPFKHNDILYVGLGYMSDLQGTMFVVALGAWIKAGSSSRGPLCIAGRMAHGKAAGVQDSLTAGTGPVSRVNYVGTKWWTGHRVKTKFVDGVSDLVDFTKAAFVTLDFDAPVSHAAVNGDFYFTTGSVLKQYAGSSVVETGFLIFPELTDDFVVAGAPGLLSAGSYSWRIYFESMLGGKRVRSYAVTITKTVLVNSSVNINVPALFFTQRGGLGNNPVNIVVYRTAVNPTASSPFYRITPFNPDGTTVGYTMTAPGDWYYNINDGVADSALILETDYLYSGEVGHVVPEIAHVTVHGQRLVGASSSELHPSLLFNVRNMVEWSDELSSEFTDQGGAITGLCTLGSNLAVFKENKVFVLGGQGPDNLGSGLYSDPYEATHSVGTYSQTTITKIPGGVAFAGPDGFYVLTEGLELKDIGAAVFELYTTAGEECFRVVFNSNEDYLAFATGTYIFVLFLSNGVWTIWTLPAAIKDVAIHDDFMSLLTTSCTTCGPSIEGNEWEDRFNIGLGVGSSDYSWITETDYVPTTDEDANSYGRAKSVTMVGRHYSDAVYGIGANYDNEMSYDAILGGTLDDEQFRSVTQSDATRPKTRVEHFFARQRCSSVRVRITLTSPDRGCALTHLVFKFKPSGNANKSTPNETT